MPNTWLAVPNATGFEYHWFDAGWDAIIEQSPSGAWLLTVNPFDDNTRQHWLGEDSAPERLFHLADALIANPRYQEPHCLGFAGATFEESLELGR